MIKKASAARFLAALAFFSGLALSIWAISLAQAQTPHQDTPISQPSPTHIAATPSASPTPTPAQAGVLYPRQPKLNAKVGTITLPSLKLSWPIFEGTTETQLRKGVGHYAGSVLPGVGDNSVLSGHRTTVFNRLGELAKGDLIFVKTSAGTFTYKVRAFRVVDRSDKTVITPRLSAVLTLTTCYPFDQIGRTTDAFIVTSDLVASNLSK